MPKSYTSKPAPGAENAAVIDTEGITFELDGVTFTLHGQLDENDLVDLATPLMDAQEGYFDPDALAAVGNFYKLIMGDETYRAFQTHRRRHRTPAPVIAEIMIDLLGEITDRPPGKPSLLPAGQLRTGVSLPDGSPSPASQPVTASSLPDQARSMPSPAGPALDPEGILPPEWAEDAEVVLAPPPAQVPAAMKRPEPAPVHRTINLGRTGPPVIRELTEDEQARVAAAAAS
jgi:hypothetical protein